MFTVTYDAKDMFGSVRGGRGTLSFKKAFLR